jgi:crossover junction endodeoxyribonuclease RusA
MSEPLILAVPANGRLWLSANDRRHWQPQRKIISSWREHTTWLAKAANLPRLESAHIIAELIFTNVSRRRDATNWAPTAKACVDGLVDAGVFEDDDNTRVIGPDMRMGPVGTREQRGLILKIFPEAS